ncbi:hypothetical protein [Elizabethkingia anophelis]|uniref:hypothetical protein n=1 Tax=Elizabethkingia anophelis TaxID=1117645 RepID=UPI0012B2BF95|nr:hypothetical protein [Elizabethkingia anophelis]QGN22527.1 hypothetical protein GJV56_07750 [Elizabethkingia anophelis]QNV09179.1 hypothetical protein EIY88_07730 [Elizabethkingia anophelis]UTF90935.1 hypothetical protein J2N93_07795 [Elizabethkingia anophelis]UTG01805.1 hypothetical protein J2O04_07800 [Elizabethkingia anophelis]UTG05555.1 hypothetical protein J2O03_07795 [Elizabethkingia anophelis]
MQRTIMLLAALLFGVTARGQIYIDPAVAAAEAAHAAVINSQLNTTNDKLTLIQRGQLAVTGQLVIVNDLQDKIYKGLSEVSAVVRNLLAVKDIADISTDIVRDVNKAMDIAGSNPVLLLFAEEGAREFKRRATALATEVGSFVTVGGRQNLMDSGERAKLLNRIVTELTILRGVAYGMYRSMYWAKQRGILNSLNPYAGFINIDKRIAEDIVRNAKYLRQ